MPAAPPRSPTGSPLSSRADPSGCTGACARAGPTCSPAEVDVWSRRHLPGGTPVRVVLAAVALAAVLVPLWSVVFPWVDTRLPFGDVTVGGSHGGT